MGQLVLLIKLVVEEISPAMLVFVRVLLGALVLLPIAIARQTLKELRGFARPLLALATIDVAAPFFLIAWGEQRISSSLAGILLAADPIFVAVLAVWFDASELVRGRRLVGLAIGASAWSCCSGWTSAATRPKPAPARPRSSPTRPRAWPPCSE